MKLIHKVPDKLNPQKLGSHSLFLKFLPLSVFLSLTLSQVSTLSFPLKVTLIQD